VTAPSVAQIAERLKRGAMARLPTTFEEFADGRASASAAVVEKPLPDLENPNSFADAGIPTHAVAENASRDGSEAGEEISAEAGKWPRSFSPNGARAQLGTLALSRSWFCSPSG